MTGSAAEQVTVHADIQPDDRRVRFEREAIPYMRQMFPAALRLTRDRCDAEDLIQETFARAYQKFHLFKAGTNLRAWLHRIMFHTFYSNYRKRQRRPAETLTGDLYAALDAGAGPVPASRSAETEALSNLASSPAMRALCDLPDCFKTAIFLVDIQGYQYGEVAEIMGTPIGTVMSRIHRGRRMLRERLRRQGSAATVKAARRAVPSARPEVRRSRRDLAAAAVPAASGTAAVAAAAAAAGPAAAVADVPLAA